MDSRRPEDVKCCIGFFRYLDAQWHEVSLKFTIPVPMALIRTLAVQVEMELGDVDQDLEDMADLCDKLLNSNISIQVVTSSIANFARIINIHFKDHLEWKIRSEKVTNCLRNAILRLPDLHQVTMLLARDLYLRFVVTPSGDDYEAAMVILDAVLTFRGSGDEPSPCREGALGLAALFADARFDTYGKPEDLEHAIYRYRTQLDEAYIKDLDRAVATSHLSSLKAYRLDDTENTLDALFVPPESGKLPSFRELLASFSGPMDVKPDPMTHITHLALLAPYINQFTDIANIEDGIKYCRLLLVSYPRSDLAEFAQLALGLLLNCAFRVTHKIEYLNEEISSTRDAINAIESLLPRTALLQRLMTSLAKRLELLRHEEDLHELMELFPIVASYGSTNSYRGLPISFYWASIARTFGHPSASTAYDHAMSWMQVSLTFAPTLDKQHSRLVATRHGLQTIPLDYASYHIDTSHLEQAIETIERGRGLLWSEMRGLRTSTDQIRLADSNLADKLSKVNQELETLSLTFSLNNDIDGNNGLEGMDPYGRGVVQKQKLLDDRERLITQIRGLSGFDTFLKPPLFDTLRSAASHGPIIIINHCDWWRSAILILFHNSPPSLIPTSDDFYIRANKLQGQLLAERKKGLESDAYEDALRAVLKELYELVGQPVIKRLNELNIPEQSRVWWCPTSVFCSLPLHAMGPIPSDVGPPQYFLDLYIPSYTPSLSTLIDSHKLNSQIF